MIFYLFYLLAAIQLFFSWRSLAGGVSFLRFFRSEMKDRDRGKRPFASVIAPCKGRDKGFRENLESLLKQEYAEYEVLFVVDSEDDPAVPVIREVISSEESPASRLVVAGSAVDTGQKVHNLIVASSQISQDSEIIAFVDSDARPSPDWLDSLAASLVSGAEIASGYRWFIPENGGLASELRSAWNASIASTLGPDTASNFSWGGSTAISRRLFEEMEVAKNWEGKLADDFALTHLIKQRGGGVTFVPKCLTASVEDCTFAELLEFTTRQMKITRVYRPDLWAFSFVGSVLYALTVSTAIVLSILSSGANRYLAALFLVLVLAAGTAKAWLRLKAVALALPEYRRRIRRQAGWQLTLWTVTPLLFLFNDLAALVSRRIVWRGIEYELESAERTRIISRDG